MELKFTEKDKLEVIKFLNLVASHAKLTLDTRELITYFKSLSFMQKELVPKIDANILEIKKVVEAESKEE